MFPQCIALSACRLGGVVFEPVVRGTLWPKAIGMLDRASNSVIGAPGTLTSSDLFTRLDRYLKQYRVKFQDLFARYDVDASGTLEAHELVALIEEVLGADVLTPADEAYLMVMLDLDGSRSVTSDEFLAAARDFMTLSTCCAVVQEKDVRATLNLVCDALLKVDRANNRVRTRRMCVHY